MSLQTIAIKTVFNGLDNDQQIDLIRDLMDSAKIDSIVHNNRPVSISGIYMNVEPDYRSNFIQYISPFLCSFLIVIEQKYIDQCFEIYKILEECSIGSRLYSNIIDGDRYLYAKDVNKEGGELFISAEEKHNIFTYGNFNQTDIELLELLCFIYDGVWISTDLTDLFVLLSNDENHAYIVLMLFGYLKDDIDIKYRTMLLEMFPDCKTVEEIVKTHKEKLSTEFTLNIGTTPFLVDNE